MGRVALDRYHANGSLDSTFSSDGKLVTDFTAGLDYASAIRLPADGKIVVAGTTDWRRRTARFALARYEVGGTLDATFGGDSKVMTNLRAWFDGAYGLAVQRSDGKIVAVGRADHLMGLVCYETDGTVDSTFAGGVALTHPRSGCRRTAGSS
jgi:uncharacterized delta-60 repeat protein